MTDRYNIKPDIVFQLKKIKDLKLVSSEYPNDWAQMPAVIYSTKAKPHKMDISDQEVLTEWTVKIDLYGNKSLSAIQSEIIQVLKEIGFKNTASDDGNQEIFKRSILTFRGVVDNRTLIVYQ
ncbi:hypothetical protein IHP33_12155 [Enterococcus faecalis]|uniref:hypothetical protein n=1 Tax=Enterococcus faecalis TaxID=1351 RepID=UPI001780CEB0|nr:hypothetical protein [Enterococcus faecalis]MBD9846473.1 hypothetical protein [Enterococcus faecalis]